jgi:NAD(P)-dependent dehydrogenase (short-subunit alcohol dehydrogenase family)
MRGFLMLLEKRTAVVTGGAGRLGRVIAATLGREGARVVIADKDRAAMRQVVERLAATSPSAYSGVEGDVSNSADVERMMTEAEAAAGPVDIVVNAHGIFPNCPILEMTVEEWDRPFAVNVRGTMLTCQFFARRWVERGTAGAIVNVSSGASRSARAGGSHYTGSKAALNMLTEVLAIELGPHGIRVNGVAPGLILDEVVTAESDSQHPYVNLMLRGTPLGRTGRAEDVAEAIAFLASDRSPWTTGALLEITGGSHCGRTHVPLTRAMR